MPKKTSLKIGDAVAVQWEDIVSFGRTQADDATLNPAVFVSYGIVSHVNQRRLIIRQEVETTPEEETAHARVIEPLCIPCGCITKITLLRPAGDATL